MARAALPLLRAAAAAVAAPPPTPSPPPPLPTPPPSGAPEATTTAGIVSGALDAGVAGFLGIPFAAPPVGSLRFRPPAAAPSWSGVRPATAAGPRCVQGAGPRPPSPCGTYCKDNGYDPDECGCGVCGSYGGCSWTCDASRGTKSHPLHKCPNATAVGAATEDSEDCLYLNVWTPAAVLHRTGGTARGELRPVMFYIHGGGFVGGSAPTTGPWNLTRLSGHVVIAIQYRLNVLGFFSTETPPPNFGMADQQFALQWTKANARAFGGDPDRVMIFGVSAGGASVAGHLVMEASFGLYHAAGLESPGGHQGWMAADDSVRTNDDWMSPDLNVRNSRALAALVNCTSPADLACLQAVDLAALYQPSRQLRFAPALATEGDYPLGLIRAGRWNRVPAIVGGQSCEECGVAEGRFGPPNATVNATQLAQALELSGFTSGAGVNATTLLTWYADRAEEEGNWRTYARILGDASHACSSTLHADALAATAPAGTVFRYFFGYVGESGTLPGATHASDESWLFARQPTSTADEVALSHDMALWWSSLAESGDPNVAGNNGAPTWTPYVPVSAPDVMFLGELHDPRPRLGSNADTVRAECEHWKSFHGWGDATR